MPEHPTQVWMKHKEEGNVTGQLTFPDTRSLKAQRPTELLEAALAWIAENPKAWDFIVAAAQRDALELGSVRVKAYIEHLRFTPLPWSNDVIKLPNGFSPVFGRLLVAWHGDERIGPNRTLADCIPIHHSKVDGCELPPRPY